MAKVCAVLSHHRVSLASKQAKGGGRISHNGVANMDLAEEILRVSPVLTVLHFIVVMQTKDEFQ